MPRLLTSTRSTLAVLLLLMGFTALGQPPVNLDVASWNVNPGTLAGVAPENRLAYFLGVARGQGIDLIAFQEVPHGLFGTAPPNAARMAVVTAAAAANGYALLTLREEYPDAATGSNGRAPASMTRTGYILAYDPTVLAPFSPNPPRQYEVATHNGQMFYADPNAFIEGISQARPPVLTHFRVNHGPNQFSELTVVNWHNEQGTFAAMHVTQFENYISNVLEPLRTQSRQNWISMADMNVRDQSAAMQSFEASFHTLAHHDAIDYIAAGVVVLDIVNNIPGLLQRFISDHDPVFGRCQLP